MSRLLRPLSPFPCHTMYLSTPRHCLPYHAHRKGSRPFQGFQQKQCRRETVMLLFPLCSFLPLPRRQGRMLLYLPLPYQNHSPMETALHLSPFLPFPIPLLLGASCQAICNMHLPLPISHLQQGDSPCQR